MQHRLSNKNIETKTADCAVCGPVGLYYRKHKNQYVCINKRRTDSVKSVTNSRRHNGWNKAKQAFLIEQDYKCAICTNPVNMSSHLDHCHTTGVYRGVLCHHCNVGIGHFRDNVEALQAAICYLQGF